MTHADEDSLQVATENQKIIGNGKLSYRMWIKAYRSCCMGCACLLQMAMYGSALVVVCFLTTLTTAKDGLQRCGGDFEAMKDNNGASQCVTLPQPNKTASVGSELECMAACLKHGCSCAHGVNYDTDDKTCQMYSEPPKSFRQLPNCIFYQVWSILDYELRRNFLNGGVKYRGMKRRRLWGNV